MKLGGKIALGVGLGAAVITVIVLIMKVVGGKKYKISTIGDPDSSGREDQLAISLVDRPPSGQIKTGNMIALEGAGKYSGQYVIQDIWIDANGNVGAVYISSNQTVSGTKTSWGTKDHAYFGKGTITVKN